jgi:hypothetical protein
MRRVLDASCHPDILQPATPMLYHTAVTARRIGGARVSFRSGLQSALAGAYPAGATPLPMPPISAAARRITGAGKRPIKRAAAS